MTSELSLHNSDYWSQLCGSRAAHKLGITAGDPGGVHIFDKWFFCFYPYLANSRFIPWESLIGQSVLEIGLGYGSVTRRLSGFCDPLITLDIAPGPLMFAAYTVRSSRCVRGNAIHLPFADDSIDNILAIGSLHHTGKMEESFRECMRVLRPGGRLIAMVYNRYSYKRWIVSPLSTFCSLLTERSPLKNPFTPRSSRRVSWFWDRNTDGLAPPHTEFGTKRQIRSVLADASSVEITTINVDNPNDLLPLRFQRVNLDRIRIRMLNSWLSRVAGLDLYIVAYK